MKQLVFIIVLLLIATGCNTTPEQPVISTNTPLPPTDIPTSTPASTNTITPSPTPQVFMDGVGGGVIAFSSDRMGSSQIFLINADGSDLRQLTFDRNGNIAPAISPNGASIAYQSNNEIVILDVLSALNGTPEIRTLTNGMYPTWASDGGKLLYTVQGDAADELWVINADGSAPQMLFGTPEAIGAADWSPDGERIVFAAVEDGSSNLYIINTNGSEKQSLTEHERDDYAPRWSPDGASIVFYSNRAGNYDIYKLDVDGENLHQLTENQEDDWWASWSPDGTKIVFCTMTGENLHEIQIMDADGETRGTLAAHGADDWWPNFGTALQATE